MVEPKKPIRSGKAPVERPNNGFTTERSVGGERRSIRHYHDGRVSQRESPTPGPLSRHESPVPGPVQALIKSKIISRGESPTPSPLSRNESPVPGPVQALTKGNTISRRESPIPGSFREPTKSNIMSKTNSTRPVSKLREQEPEPEYKSPTLAEIERLSGAVTTLFHPDRSKPFEKPPPRTESPQSWSSESSYGMVTPPFPVASPTPGDSPELMSTDVFLLPATARSDGSDDDADSISKQWNELGGKKRIGNSDIHD
ncbi:uncharacterized protein N7518_001446 [Penicillium psychrosexuale]|uniref:uncharacterized protein n=1 Tax=Penicillium psychrosexuale TaxID=1002107 RepID=UPI002544E060|nr:uncharacterized protein N7518_001446 [Penicillium psychrosexuale]KAJ5799378.1 hypothetical protein N7518_001446 [Penicillium psychrosexuale]